MSNNYVPYFNRINLRIIPSYIELPCFYHFCPSGSTLSQVTTLVIFFNQLLLYTFPVASKTEFQNCIIRIKHFEQLDLNSLA